MRPGPEAQPAGMPTASIDARRLRRRIPNPFICAKIASLRLPFLIYTSTHKEDAKPACSTNEPHQRRRRLPLSAAGDSGAARGMTALSSSARLTPSACIALAALKTAPL